MARSLFLSKAKPRGSAPKSNDALVRSYSNRGISFVAQTKRSDWLFNPLSMGVDADLTALLSQLEEQGLARFESGELFLSWDDIFKISNSPDYGSSYPVLALPPISHLRPSLASHGSFSDPDFSIFISGWVERDGSIVMGDVRLTGALMTSNKQIALLDGSVWRLVTAVSSFHQTSSEVRTAQSNRMVWGEIRRCAKEARAELSHFLESTVVVTADKLDIRLRRNDVGGAKVIEVIPTFEGQPSRWIEIFDRTETVRDRYEIPDGEGLTHVVTTPEVRTVLSEIKRMPGRRIVGDRAEAFIRNPFAALGPAADDVVNPAQFEQARESAGIIFSTFTAQIERDGSGSVVSVALLVEEKSGPTISSEVVPFADPAQLEAFLKKIEARIRQEAQCCSWQGNDLEILGDTPDQVALLRQAHADWSLPGAFKASEIFDLSHYSDRIEGFGLEKPYFSPFIARKTEGDGWFPENVVFGLQFTPEGGDEPLAVAFSDSSLGEFAEALQRAKDEGRSSFSFVGLPKPIDIRQAEVMLTIFKEAQTEIVEDKFRPQELSPKAHQKRKGLIVKANVNKVDYQELRGTLSVPEGALPLLPAALKSGVTLKDHQLAGVAWLQHLWKSSPTSCRGALLADDMGLGKTIQLLTFIAHCLEQDPFIDPMLIVAPVSLLENWKEEVSKFFEPDTFPIVTLYGSALREKRLPQNAIEEELRGAGIGRLLMRNWLGNAKVVLTTYETLRDLEFSLARQKWSVMICDEAQKIKNPNAMVSRSAKKQNARFKIACTGTPVENTLTDLWCLFDFIQPGLLGALSDFGNTYRRPIEAETEQEKIRLGELRALIEPQKLRRTKSEVAKDLPSKIEDPNCRSLPISDRQRELYGKAVMTYRTASKNGANTALSSHLGLLSYLRTVCSDPRPPEQPSSYVQSLAELQQDSPKMAWMLRELLRIREQREKAIVFCEFRDLQRTIQRAVAEQFGLVADIINGDTSTAAERDDNRQKRIKSFQQSTGFGVIILSPLAIGFGVNIQAANHVIHFTRTWNPAREDQATDRAYRIGQTKDVYVYYPVVVAEDFVTFDQKLDQLLGYKRKLSQDMLNGYGDVGHSDFADLQDPNGKVLFDTP